MWRSIRISCDYFKVKKHDLDVLVPFNIFYVILLIQPNLTLISVISQLDTWCKIPSVTSLMDKMMSHFRRWLLQSQMRYKRATRLSHSTRGHEIKLSFDSRQYLRILWKLLTCLTETKGLSVLQMNRVAQLAVSPHLKVTCLYPGSFSKNHWE